MKLWGLFFPGYDNVNTENEYGKNLSNTTYPEGNFDRRSKVLHMLDKDFTNGFQC